jgi:OOP family OmpA-OmpF porin
VNETLLLFQREFSRHEFHLRTNNMNKISGLLIAAMAAAALLPLTATAQIQDTKNQGYLLDRDTGFVTNASGQCWHTGDWTPARAVEPCDPAIKQAATIVPAPRPAEVVAAAPIVAPAPAAVPPMKQKISFSGDALFAFDKSVLKPEGQTMLDGLVQQLSGATYDTVLATGHTDRLGSNAYNQKLSERRAQTVKDYLVSKNVQASRIDAQGKGETEPVTKPGECRGAQSVKVVACLQPDRRVDVEMTGTKAATGTQ